MGERSFSKSWGLPASVSFFPLPLPRHSFFFALFHTFRTNSCGNACYAGYSFLFLLSSFLFPLSSFLFPLSSFPFPLSSFLFPLSSFPFPLSYCRSFSVLKILTGSRPLKSCKCHNTWFRFLSPERKLNVKLRPIKRFRIV